MSRTIVRRLLASVAASATLASCLVSFEDYPVQALDAAGAGSGGAEDGPWPSGGNSGAGGLGGAGGSSGAGGGVADASAGAAGSGGAGGSAGMAPADAATDQTINPLCVGFFSEPSKPLSPNFVLVYSSSVPYACIGWKVTCTGTSPTTSPAIVPSCPLPHCWATTVSNCGPGPAFVEFLHEKDVDGTGQCNLSFPGSPGKPAASCNFNVSPAQ